MLKAKFVPGFLDISEQFILYVNTKLFKSDLISEASRAFLLQKYIKKRFVPPLL